MEQLIAAYFDGSWERRYYYDRMTVAVICIPETVRNQLQAIYDEVGEDDVGELSADLAQAHAVEMDDSRYLKVPEWKTAWQDRDQFATLVPAPLQRLLWRALDLQNAALFERTLSLEPDQAAAWQQFKQTRARTFLMAWLKACDG